ncbi:MAG: type II toxin-antitoxin system RelB/DinJ family antitoxin [Clostridiales bacterium]|nr:type II toxin-antitoxin system RelB/DinJ family antitoxin [Clostridiales bacterium]
MEVMDLVQVRTPKNVKTNAMDILDKLGLNMSTYINMALNQLIIQGGIPFTVKLERPVYSAEDIVQEIEATMKMEGMPLPQNEVERLKLIVSGKMTTDQARQDIYREVAEWQMKNTVTREQTSSSTN